MTYEWLRKLPYTTDVSVIYMPGFTVTSQHTFLSLHLRTCSTSLAIYCDSDPSWHHPQCNLTTRHFSSHQLYTPFSISNTFHMQLGRSHGYFQGIFPSQTILLSKNFQLCCKGLNTMVHVCSLFMLCSVVCVFI